MNSLSTDVISIEGLAAQGVVGLDQWGRPSSQPFTVTLHFHLHPSSLLLAAATDDTRFGIRTWDVFPFIHRAIQTHAPFSSGRALAKTIFAVAIDPSTGEACQEIRLLIDMPKAQLCLRTDGGVSWQATSRGGNVQDIAFAVKGLMLPISSGVDDDERSLRQNAAFDMLFEENQDEVEDFSYTNLVENIIKFIESSNFRSVERLILEAISIAFMASSNIRQITMRVKRTKAHVETDSTCVQITRQRSSSG